MSPALACRFLTTAPPEKSQKILNGGSKSSEEIAIGGYKTVPLLCIDKKIKIDTYSNMEDRK